MTLPQLTHRQLALADAESRGEGSCPTCGCVGSCADGCENYVNGVLVCAGCKKPYRDFPLDVVIPDDQWLAINGRDGGVLCAACIVERGAKLPGVTVARLVFDSPSSKSQARRHAAMREGESVTVDIRCGSNPIPHCGFCQAEKKHWLDPCSACGATVTPSP